MSRQVQLPIDPGRPAVSSLVDPDGPAMLDQNRLDVTTKTRSNIFNWRGQFTPQFVDYLIEEFGAHASTVADPFCGSGTVLLESAYRGIPAYGTELHPDGRILRYVMLPTGEHVNATLIREGYARATGTFPYSRQRDCLQLEAQARQVCRGRWSR